MKTKIIILMMLIVFALALNCYAEIPHLMNFQGKATDKAGMPLNGTYNLTFRIYNHQTAGTLKWTETQPNITITNGIFQVLLGSITPLSLPFNENYWISVEVNTDGEMSPRTRLASVAYAYKAEKANSLTEDAVVSFYRKGFDIEYVDFNSIKVTPGVIEIAGKMFTTTTYSNNLLLEYLTPPANKDWVHGSKTNDSLAYVYTYDNNSTIDFKFSDEAPDLSDHLGNTAKQPLQYQRYPDTAEGIYYRCLGRVKVNTSGIIADTENLIDDAIAANNVFDDFEAGFAGDGSDGDVTISADTDIFGQVKQYNNLTVNPGVTLIAKNSVIGVRGTLTIKGTISAKGGGGVGGSGGSWGGGGSSGAPPVTSYGSRGVDGDKYGLGGSGGNGGHYGGRGGDTSKPGSNPGLSADPAYVQMSKIFNKSKLLCLGKGAGGGGGGVFHGPGGYAYGGSGGDGGGFIYIEANKLDFQAGAIITVAGINGGNGTANSATAGGGGGGGGGFVWVRYNTLIRNNGTFNINSGAGGSGTEFVEAGSPGGAGQYYLSKRKERFYF